jgi:hypothetical protein
MIDYIKTIIAGMPKDMEGAAKIPAGSYLFKVSDNPVLLDKETAETYQINNSMIKDYPIP